MVLGWPKSNENKKRWQAKKVVVKGGKKGYSDPTKAGKGW